MFTKRAHLPCGAKILLAALLSAAGAPAIHAPIAVAAAVTCPNDEFDGPVLDPTRWDVFHGSPFVDNGELVMAGTPTSRVDVQSKGTCRYGVLTTEVRSTSWQPQNGYTDTSLGFEHFTGTNGGCHVSVQMVGSGLLAVLKAIPDAEGRCFGDPAEQAFVQVSNWEQLRQAPSLRVYLGWGKGVARLVVTDGSTVGLATYTGSAVPDVPMKLRLNTDTREAHRYGWVRGSYRAP